MYRLKYLRLLGIGRSEHLNRILPYLICDEIIKEFLELVALENFVCNIMRTKISYEFISRKIGITK